MNTENTIESLAKIAKKASLSISTTDTDKKNRLLMTISNRIEENSDQIAAENQKDIKLAEELVQQGKLSKPLLERLILTEAKIKQLTTYLEEVANLDDPVGKKQYAMKLADGLELERISCPIGLIAIIFESRPEVVIQVTALSLKSGNGVILKGGTEAQHTNRVLFNIIEKVLQDFKLQNTVNLVETREDVAELLKQDDSIDLIIPRGSNQFVKYIQDNSRIPVLGHSSGICHIYVDNPQQSVKTIPIILDAKLDYPSACNALETLLIHKESAAELLPDLIEKLQENNVICRGCAQTIEIAEKTGKSIEQATQQDWNTEYTDLILSIKIVASLEEGIDHINAYGSHHTDSIISENQSAAEHFLTQVDSACVFHNASTRFSDGYVFGLGAEVGISTNKTHSRGPVGLDGMIIYKYLLRGNGHLKASFSGNNAIPFIHSPLPLK
jgi:glutamate-5-semialdehyde dehydrogenase